MDGMRASFPVVLTHKYACDETVLALLRARTLGNSPGALRNNLKQAPLPESSAGDINYQVYLG